MTRLPPRPERGRAAAEAALALAAFLAAAVAYTWPLAARFTDRYPGTLSESSSNVWNIWHFRFCVERGLSPFWTELQHWPHGTNLLLAQYTLPNGLLSLLGVPWLGLAGFYNAMYLLALALCGALVYGFARDWGFGRGAAAAAGAAYAFSPYTARQIDIGRGADYMNYWPAALFVWGLSRAVRSRRVGDCALAAAGLAVQWLYSYHYFLVCVMAFPLFFLMHERPAEVRLEPRPPSALRRAVAAAALAAGAWALWGVFRGQREFHGAGSARVLAAYLLPYAAFWALAGAWAAARWRPRARLRKAPGWEELAPYLGTAACWLAFCWPMAWAVAAGMASGDYGSPSNWWRGGGNPIDASLLTVLNRYHPLWEALRPRLGSWPIFSDGLRISFGLCGPAAAVWLWRNGLLKDPWRKAWAWGAALSALLCFGPWLKVMGTHLYLPLPFFFLHALPVYVQMTTGEHFQVLASLFLALLVGAAADELSRRGGARARWAVPAVLAALALELWPRPMPLWAVEAPPVLRRLRERPEGAMLTVPVYSNFHVIANPGHYGEDITGNILAAQIIHQKPVTAGFLGRVAMRVFRWTMADPFFTGLLEAQEGRAPPAPRLRDRRQMARYLRDIRVRYVLTREGGLPPALRAALRGWPMRLVDEGEGLRLYEVEAGGEGR